MRAESASLVLNLPIATYPQLARWACNPMEPGVQLFSAWTFYLLERAPCHGHHP